MESSRSGGSVVGDGAVCVGALLVTWGTDGVGAAFVGSVIGAGGACANFLEQVVPMPAIVQIPNNDVPGYDGGKPYEVYGITISGAGEAGEAASWIQIDDEKWREPRLL